MSRISKMRLEDILKQTDVVMQEGDIIYICDNIEVIEEFTKKFKSSAQDREDIKQFLIDNEQYIDKERFILLTVKNYKENLKMIDREILKFKDLYSKNRTQGIVKNISTMTIQKHQQEENLSRAIRLGEGIEVIYSVYYYDEKENKCKVEVVDSREIIGGKKNNSTKNLRRFDELDLSFKGGNPNEELGIEYVLQSMLLSDISTIFYDEQLGNNITTMIFENGILSRGIQTKQELKELESEEEYRKLVYKISVNALLPEIKATLRQYAQYVDFDKLLLVSAYRFNKLLENKVLEPEMQLAGEEILNAILHNIKSNNSQIFYEIKDKNGKTIEKIEYSVKDIRKCLSQFNEEGYVTSKEIEEYKTKINGNEIRLSDIPSNSIDIIFSQRELEELSTSSLDNLLFVYKKYNWNQAKVIEMYENNKISLEYLKEIKEEIDFSEYVSFEKLNLYYKEMNNNEEDKTYEEKYERYLDLYKEIFVVGQSKEDIQKVSKEIIENLVENTEGQEYKNAVKNYFNSGILTLDSILEWNGEELITELYNEGLIDIEQLRTIGLNLGYDYLHNIYYDLINSEEIEYDKRIEYIESGFVEEDDIIEVYNKGLIMDEDLLKLAKKALISLEVAQEIIDNRNLEDRIKAARAKAIGWSDSNLLFHIDGIEKKHSDGVMYTDISIGGPRKEKLIIDPNIRQEYIEMLGLYRIETECSEENPFYHYEFYATPDESGSIGANSVIIAERYYTNKIEEKNFATNNATYFFKYKDFLVLSNLQKADMIKERENVVFRANHTLSTGKKRGTWAENVLYNVLKTMMGSDLKELTEKEKRKKLTETMSQMYLREECEAILDLCKRIDSGEYICRADRMPYRRAKSSVGPNFDDDDDGTR